MRIRKACTHKSFKVIILKMVCAPTSERLQVKVLRFFSAFFFVSYHRDNLLKEWDLSTCTCLRSLQGHKGPVFCVKVGLGSFICAPFNEHKLLSLYFRYTTITLTTLFPGRPAQGCLLLCRRIYEDLGPR